MQVAAIGFSLAPLQNTEMTDAAVNPAAVMENGSPGESLFTQLLLSGMAKSEPGEFGELGELLPAILEGEDTGEDKDAACDISAVFAQLFAPKTAQTNTQTNTQAPEMQCTDGAQTGEIAEISPDAPALNTQTMQKPDLPATGVTEQTENTLPEAENTDTRQKAEALPENDVPETKGARPPAETKDFKTVMNDSSAKPGTAEKDENDAQVLNGQNEAPAREAETPEAQIPLEPRERPAMAAQQTQTQTQPQPRTQDGEKPQELDLKDFIGKVSEAARSMSGEKTGGGGAEESFTAEKKETAPLSKAENDIPAQTVAPEFKTEITETEKAASVEKALGSFAKDLKSVERGVSEIKIVLEPESLGTLTISVSKTENGITARIKSDDREICGIISGQLGKLISSLESNGVKLEDVDVLFGGAGQEFGFAQESSSDSRGWTNQQRGYSQQPRDKADSAETFTKLRDFQGADDGVSRVIEYRI